MRLTGGPASSSSDAIADGGGNWYTPVAWDAGTPNLEQKPEFLRLREHVLLWPTPGPREQNGERAERRGGTLYAANGVKVKRSLGQQALWPTPTASDGPGKRDAPGRKGGQSLSQQTAGWPTPTASSQTTYKNKQPTLHGMAQNWPTPTASSSGREHKGGNPMLKGAALQWPTPMARTPAQLTAAMAESARAKAAGEKTGYGIELHEAAAAKAGSGMLLGAGFVEWLMGYPLGWSDAAAVLPAGSLAAWRRHRGLAAGDPGPLAMWPPRPADDDAWAAVIRGRPDLAPAVPGGGVADVKRLKLRLHALGNAVVPETVALAFLLLDNLMSEMGRRGRGLWYG